MTKSIEDNFTPIEWEDFCEVVLRQHFGQRNFQKVPAEDRGDLGIEFYTSCGTIFQCYYPDPTASMATYKTKVQTKIRNDLKKLTTYKEEIAELLDGIIIDQWVLMIPTYKTKELIKYCNSKKKNVLKEKLDFIDEENFIVKIETADSYPKSRLYALSVHSRAIDIPLMNVTRSDQKYWSSVNSSFSDNIHRKCNTLMGDASSKFIQKVIEKYIQVDNFLEILRNDHPDLYNSIEDSANAQLEETEQEAIFSDVLDSSFVKKIVDGNKNGFERHSQLLSRLNSQILPFGYLSKWLAECDMDFVYEETKEDKNSD